jgi:hypothetical protein
LSIAARDELPSQRPTRDTSDAENAVESASSASCPAMSEVERASLLGIKRVSKGGVKPEYTFWNAVYTIIWNLCTEKS